MPTLCSPFPLAVLLVFCLPNESQFAVRRVGYPPMDFPRHSVSRHFSLDHDLSLVRTFSSQPLGYFRQTPQAQNYTASDGALAAVFSVVDWIFRLFESVKGMLGRRRQTNTPHAC